MIAVLILLLLFGLGVWAIAWGGLGLLDALCPRRRGLGEGADQEAASD